MIPTPDMEGLEIMQWESKIPNVYVHRGVCFVDHGPECICNNCPSQYHEVCTLSVYRAGGGGYYQVYGAQYTREQAADKILSRIDFTPSKPRVTLRQCSTSTASNAS